jgi:sec-independent protein translocase protein TatB
MFDLDWTELLLIGIVALIVVGPKDLPVLFRNVGRFMGKARGMARECSRAMEAAADESGIKDMTNTIRAASDPKKFGADALKDATSFAKGPATQELAAQRKAAKAKADDLAKTTQENAARAAVKAAPATPPAPKPAAPADVADTPKDKA